MTARHPLPKVALHALMALVLALGLGCASRQAVPAPPTTPPVSGGPSDPVDPGGGLNQPLPDPGTGPVPLPVSTSPSGMQRVAAAGEGALLGTVLGGSIGGVFGAAAGAVVFGLYGAVMGEAPMRGGGVGVGYPTGGYPSGGYPAGTYPADPGADDLDREIEDDLERELARQDSLESEIDVELRRQEELLKQIEHQEEITESDEVFEAPDVGQAMQDADPRTAPKAPADRDLPLSIFDEESRTVPPGTVGNTERTEVVVRSLDADRDGAPEEIRYHDPKTGAIVHKEEDKDYDGRIDTWTTYESGMPSRIEVDNDHDGKPDEWQTYDRSGRMSRREVDRDGDGTRDAFFTYEGDSLVEEEHDGDSNGATDRIVHYEGRKLARTEEDSTKDGKMDTWTVFTEVGGREVVQRIEKDTSGDGRPDTFETYEVVGDKTLLKLREEDKNGDGTVDVKSVYEGGKLKQREISDPALLPL